MTATPLLGMQPGSGISAEPVYTSAAALVHDWSLPRSAAVIDVGGGIGNFARRLLADFDSVDILDCEKIDLGPSIRYFTADLNGAWPVDPDSYDAVISLEVIEHLQNPRHFLREANRIVKPGGRLLVSTPNQLSLASKLCLVWRDCFQQFQDTCYPAHITALLSIDLVRMARECGMQDIDIHFTDEGRIPFTTVRWQRFSRSFRGKNFSDSVFLSARKPAARAVNGD